MHWIANGSSLGNIPALLADVLADPSRNRRELLLSRARELLAP